MFDLENTACLSTFVKMSLYNSEENICSVGWLVVAKPQLAVVISRY